MARWMACNIIASLCQRMLFTRKRRLAQWMQQKRHWKSFSSRGIALPPDRRKKPPPLRKLRKLFSPIRMPIKIQTDYRKYPNAIKHHLTERFRDRQFLLPMAQELAAWLQTRPSAPNLLESPAGWHKNFSSFTVFGEGEFLKTLFTIYSPGRPRKSSVDLDRWHPQ